MAKNSPRPSTCPDQSSQEPCCAGLDRGDLLALAERNEEVAEKAAQEGKKPNILVIFGDDIGLRRTSAPTPWDSMGYRTPNIDRIAREGMIFTDYYAEQSCTAGRSSFITGQCTFRTGLSQGRRACVSGRAQEGRSRRSPSCSRTTVTPRASSARTTWAT